MMNIEYFELYPFCPENNSFRVGFDDDVKSVKKKIKGIVHTNLDVLGSLKMQLTGVSGIKADVPVKLGLRGWIDLKDPVYWSQFNMYTYCMLQLSKRGTLDLIAISNIGGMQNISVEEKRRSFIKTDTGEISLYDLCVDLKITAPNKNNDFNILDSSDLFKEVYVVLAKNVLYFIKYKESTKGEIFKHLHHIEVMRLLGMKTFG